MAKRKALGRGLGALLPPQEAAEAESGSGIQTVSVDAIRPNPSQPRSRFDQAKLQELADSIISHGLLQPLVVSDNGDGTYTLIAGERRWRACQMAGIEQLPVIIKDVSPQDRLELALIENIQRADLNPIEEAMAYHQLVEEFGLTQAKMAERVGKSRSEVANRLRLLELPPDVQQAVTDEKLSYGHARVLAGLPTPEAQRSLMGTILKQALSVRQAEAIAQKLKEGDPPLRRERPRLSPELEHLESRLRERLGTRVTLQRSRQGTGKVIIHFYNDEDLQSIYEAIVDEEL
jgi:ParB family chromosome partitioning protein